MRLAIADPPYPPAYAVRYDVADPAGRLTTRSRATRWYGDQHPDAADFDRLEIHQQLMHRLIDTYDGWAIATTPDGLGAYHPLPAEARIMAWVRSTAQPGGQRLISAWEPVIIYTPPTRRARTTGPRMRDVLTTAVPQTDFTGAKPAAWTHWVLEALGHQPDDTVHDIFPGSHAVTHALAQEVLW